MEKEIKLLPSQQTQLKLKAAIGRLGEEHVLAELLRTIGLTGAEIITNGFENILDDYWDTDNFALFRCGSCFRLRTTKSGITLYVKNHGDRHPQTGLFKREEMSSLINGDDALRGIYVGFKEQRIALLPQYSEAEFCQVLRVNNQRRQFLLKRRDEEYELVIDFYHFSSSKYAKISPEQSEIELEALNKAAESKIDEIAQLLLNNLKGARPSRESKYERGVKKLWLLYPEWLLRFLESVDTMSVKWIVAGAAVVGLFISLLPYVL